MSAAPRRDEGSVREGEALDVAIVDAWLKQRLPHLEGTPAVTQYSGGASNWTYRLKYANDDVVLRRAPAGTKAAGAHDMAREFCFQQALKPSFELVPRMLALCEDAALIGSPFYVMERLDGLIPRKELPRDVALDRYAARTLCTSALDALVALHAVDATTPALAAFGRGAGYAKRQIDGWSERFRRARTWNVPRFTEVMRWLATEVPADSATCVIHNDYRFDNLVLDRNDPTRIIGVLDWEMATLGDPLMDVGNSLAYWVQADDDRFIRAMRRQPTHLPGMLTRTEVIEYYELASGRQASGRRSEHWAFYEVYGLFRLAAIVQQIYFRYHQRQTRNPAFRHFWLWVHYLERRCRQRMRAD